MVFPIAFFIWEGAYHTAFILMLIAGLSDALDGFLARTFHWQSKLGALLDPAADKLLLVSIFVICGLKGFLPLWLVGLIFLRDIIIVVGAFFYQQVTQDKKIKPLLISKLNTALQILLAVLTLYQAALQPFSTYINTLLIISVTLTTLVSGIAYVMLWTRYTMEYKNN
jgi:cardiolipin synthase